MTPAAAVVAVAVMLALIVIAYLAFGYLERGRASSARNDPWAQLGGGVGSIVSSIGGFVNMGSNTGTG